jgi:hypothetical protein
VNVFTLAAACKAGCPLLLLLLKKIARKRQRGEIFLLKAEIEMLKFCD